MSRTAKHLIVVVATTMYLIGPMVSVRADDATTAPPPATTQPDATAPATTPPPATQPDATAPATTQPIEAPPLALQPPENQPDKWSFTSPAYAWIAGLSGTVEAHGHTANVDASAQDIFKHSDFGFVGYFQLAKPRYGFYTEPTYLELSDSGHAGPVSANVDVQALVLDFGGFYKFFEWEGEHQGSLAAVAAGRYYYLHTSLTLSNPELGKVSTGDTRSLIDPIIGLRYEQYIIPKLHVWCQGDIGGFDISEDTTRFSWQLQPTLGYDFTMIVIKKPSTVLVGYRALNIQNRNGDNSFHIGMNGVVLGLNVNLF